MCYTFLYKKIEEFKDNEKNILDQLNILIKDHLSKSHFARKFKEFYNRYNYKIKFTLEDLNEKFISINFVWNIMIIVQQLVILMM